VFLGIDRQTFQKLSSLLGLSRSRDGGGFVVIGEKWNKSICKISFSTKDLESVYYFPLPSNFQE
jgi:hypothetical protein